MNTYAITRSGARVLTLAALLLALVSAAAQPAGPKLTLASDGRPAATIVVSKTAGHVPWFAAGELQYHVKKITGATLPIVTDEMEVRGTRILVGASRQTEALGLPHADFQPQEYLIRFQPDALILMGRDRENDAFPVRVTGQPQRAEGRFGRSLEFTGAQALSISSHGFADEAGTLEAWVWLGSERPDAGTIFRLDGSPWTYHIVDTQGDALRYVVYDGKSGHSVTSAKLANGWHHLCATHDARAGTLELFVDGVSCGTAAYTRSSCSNAPILLMGALVADGKTANPFRGRLDEVRVSRSVRPPTADWATKPGATDTDTLVRLSFDEDAGPPRELSGRLRQTTPPSLEDAMSPQGTCYAAYDFLERFCDVRWYAPTELGMVCPTRATLEVSGADIRRRPAFEFRHHAPSGISKAYIGLSTKPTAEEQRLFIARRRIGGRSFATNHSFYDFYDRFWEKNPRHPELFEARREEYWAKGYKNKPPQLCYTSPQLVAQVVKDARAKLDAGADYVQLVPMDNDQQCQCANCQALIDKENKSKQFSTGKASGLFWTFANAVAREVRQSHPDKFVGTLAYFDYAFPPRFDVEPNILVGPCLHTRNWWSPSMERNDMAFYQGWLRQAPGRLHCVWLYQCFPDEIAENNKFKQFPGFHAHTLSRQFQMFARDKVRGFFLCGVACYIDGYLTFRCLDDPFFDVDRALDEFFTRYYGPAAAPMKQLYLGIEQTYMTPANYPESVQKDDIHFHQSEEMAWKYLGTAERMADWAKLLEQAQAAASTPEHKQRVAIFANDLWADMLEGRQKWESRVTPSKPGLLAVFAHPDDDTTCSGTLARAAAAGWQVTVIHATSGGGGQDVSGRSLQGTALAAEREREAVESLTALGLKTPPLFLRLSSGTLRQNETQVVARLVQEIRRLAPAVILTFGPDGFTGHPTHIAIGKATDTASQQAAPQAALYHVALGQRLPGWAKAAGAPIPAGATPPANLVTVQVGEHQAKRLEALKSYRTQWTPEVLGRLVEFHQEYSFEEFVRSGGPMEAAGKWVGP